MLISRRTGPEVATPISRCFSGVLSMKKKPDIEKLLLSGWQCIWIPPKPEACDDARGFTFSKKFSALNYPMYVRSIMPKVYGKSGPRFRLVRMRPHSRCSDPCRQTENQMRELEPRKQKLTTGRTTSLQVLCKEMSPTLDTNTQPWNFRTGKFQKTLTPSYFNDTRSHEHEYLVALCCTLQAMMLECIRAHMTTLMKFLQCIILYHWYQI